MSDRLFVGLSGLATDVQTLEQLLRFRLNMYKLREERDVKPETFSALLSHILYEKRWVRFLWCRCSPYNIPHQPTQQPKASQLALNLS